MLAPALRRSRPRHARQGLRRGPCAPPSSPKHAIAQTNLARLNAVILRADLGGMPAYDILSDIASAAYLWEALRDAMAEFDGAPVGLAAIRALDRGEGQPNQ